MSGTIQHELLIQVAKVEVGARHVADQRGEDDPPRRLGGDAFEIEREGFAIQQHPARGMAHDANIG